MKHLNMNDEHDNPVHYACLMLNALGLNDPHLSQNNEGDPVIAFTFNDVGIFNPYMTENGFDQCDAGNYGLTGIQANALCKINDALGFNWGL
jgi:hypothetical protein